jgi:hypothetical protein
VAALALALAFAGDALACTCPGGLSVEERLASADAAFVGRLVAVRGTSYEFEVDQRVKGDLGERVAVRSGRDTAQCGLRRTAADEAVGVLLTRASGGWASSLCAQTTPGELLGSETPERGQWPRLLVGVGILALVLAYSVRRLRRRGREPPG